ncbi:MAG: helix-turn-helix domain-containing protein [Candidatus Omnitrophica bacterium]|nr:helix-turn-helix domain-containing protein [Candidatus Omnitrophota bacterium]
MEKSIKLLLGKKIKEIRQKNKLTQERLSEMADIDYKYLQKIEGKNPPNIKIETIEKIAKALKITPSKLLDF